eukprot:TRINITY_DN1926_c0_g2_i1.p1 TRINITY_DN1926_c0_g2~~TRINITY_DN1926_c0_g2_i1.p1  ORF type:complete len:309 (-),score=106.74 TRINITY_DN1926_c0_g2_i1:61-987(-)
MESAVRVCVTGAAGQIGYSLLPLICTGRVFGAGKKVHLRLLDIAPMEEVLKGVLLEIEDGAYPLVASIQISSDPRVAFKDADFVIFLGGFPRKPGMERRELLQINGKIFKEQGEALNEVANADVKCLVVANPANTNCLILLKNAPRLSAQNFSCLTRLDHNRALAQLAIKSSVTVDQVKNVIIWGNHSTTQYPDVNHGTIGAKPIREVINDNDYLNGPFIERVQKRGGEVLAQRKNSSVMSAANAVADHIITWIQGTPEGEWTSMGVYSNGEYDTPKDLVFSFPVRCKDGKFEIVTGLTIDELSLIHI